MRRLAAMFDPGIESPVRLGVANEFPKLVLPAFSMKGFTVVKLAWLNALMKVVWNSKEVCSPNFTFLKTLRFPVLVGASRREFRATLPNGDPKICWANAVLAMKCTSFWVTVTVEGVFAFKAFKLTNWLVAKLHPRP